MPWNYQNIILDYLKPEMKLLDIDTGGGEFLLSLLQALTLRTVFFNSSVRSFLLKGNLHNPQAVNRTIKRIRENYNAEEILKAKKEKREPIIIPHFSCHHLRHTFCTRFCENETNIKVIQAVMGHANIETTMDIYAEVTDMKKTDYENDR